MKPRKQGFEQEYYTVRIYHLLKSQGILPVTICDRQDYGAKMAMQSVLAITDANVILVPHRTLFTWP